MLIVNMVVFYVIFDFVFVLFFLTTFFLLKFGEAALHKVIHRGSEQIVKILVEHGSNLDLQAPVFIFFFFDFHFLFCFFSFLYLLLWVHCWVGFMLIVNGYCVV